MQSLGRLLLSRPDGLQSVAPLFSLAGSHQVQALHLAWALQSAQQSAAAGRGGVDTAECRDGAGRCKLQP